MNVSIWELEKEGLETNIMQRGEANFIGFYPLHLFFPWLHH